MYNGEMSQCKNAWLIIEMAEIKQKIYLVRLNEIESNQVK